MNQPIIVSYPCNDMIHADFTHCLTMMMLYSVVKAQLWVGVAQTRGSIICASRNTQVKQARNNPDGFSHLLFLDSDMVFPASTLSRLLSHNKAIVGASYCMRREPRAMTHRNGDFSSVLPDVNSANDVLRYGIEGNNIYPVLSLGMGCVLIRSDVFTLIRDMDPMGPFFQVTYHGEDHHTGEDVTFFQKVNAASIPVYCDIGLSREIGHVGLHTYKEIDVQKVYDGTEPRFESQSHRLPQLDGEL